MRTLAISLAAIIVLLSNACAADLSQIRTTLLSTPPNGGDQAIRRQTILELDTILSSDSAEASTVVKGFLVSMLQKVQTEMAEPVPVGETRIWQMYNHGYIVKTSSTVFGFDLSAISWQLVYPPSLIAPVEVMLLTHMHGDHYDANTVNRIIANGGEVLVPNEDDSVGTIPMSPGMTVSVGGLTITAYDGLHSVPLRIYEVVTPDGIRIVHTGDNQTSTTLPIIDSIDVLLLNSWVNESGTASSVVGMTNAIQKMAPIVTIPGHMQEMGHEFIVGDPRSRVPYEWPLAVDTLAIPGSMCVMAWGELYEMGAAPATVLPRVESTRHHRALDYRVHVLRDAAAGGCDLKGRTVSVSGATSPATVRVGRQAAGNVSDPDGSR